MGGRQWGLLDIAECDTYSGKLPSIMLNTLSVAPRSGTLAVSRRRPPVRSRLPQGWSSTPNAAVRPAD